MNRKIGLFSSTLILIGAMIGSAIFSLSGIIMYQAGPASIITWLIAALIMLIYGLLMSELALNFPYSGGVYIFPFKTIGGNIGRFLAWIACWGFILCNTMALAFSAIYIGKLLVLFLNLSYVYTSIIAIISVILIMFVNLISFNKAKILNNFFVIILLLTLSVYIVCCVSNENFNLSKITPFFTQGIRGPNGFVSMIPTAIVGYGAVASIAFLASDIKNPKKNIPLSCLLAILFVFIVYAALIASTMGIITVDYLSQHQDDQYVIFMAVCFDFLNNSAIVSIFLCCAGVIALFTSMFVMASLNGQALSAVSKDRIIPKFFSKENKYKEPYISIIVVCFISAVISCFEQFVYDIVSFGVIFNVITIIITTVSVFFLKTKHNNNVFKASIRKFLAILLIITLLICNYTNIVQGGIEIYIFTIIFIIIAIIIYLVGYFKYGKK